MSSIIQIGSGKKVFSVKEARSLVGLIKKITTDAKEVTDILFAKLQNIDLENSERIEELEIQIEKEIQNWQQKVRKLGAEPKSLWFVDFDSGDGYFCWQYPQHSIAHWHKYEDGVSQKTPIEDWEQSINADANI